MKQSQFDGITTIISPRQQQQQQNQTVEVPTTEKTLGLTLALCSEVMDSLQTISSQEQEDYNPPTRPDPLGTRVPPAAKEPLTKSDVARLACLAYPKIPKNVMELEAFLMFLNY